MKISVMPGGSAAVCFARSLNRVIVYQVGSVSVGDRNGGGLNDETGPTDSGNMTATGWKYQLRQDVPWK